MIAETLAKVNIYTGNLTGYLKDNKALYLRYKMTDYF